MLSICAHGCVNVLPVKIDEKEVEKGGGDGFANDVFSAGFLVKGSFIYVCYLRIGVILL